MTVETLAAWLLAIMLASLPPGRSLWPAEAREAAEQGRARYAAIAQALAEVSLDPKEQPPLSGPDGRAQTAALLLAISYFESHWRRDVDLGLSQRPSRYHCLMQIGLSPVTQTTGEGWTAKQLVESRRKCFRAALHLLQRGRRVCAAQRDPRAFVNHYATGYCDRGRKAVQLRWQLYEQWLARYPLKALRKQAAAEPQQDRPTKD